MKKAYLIIICFVCLTACYKNTDNENEININFIEQSDVNVAIEDIPNEVDLNLITKYEISRYDEHGDYYYVFDNIDDIDAINEFLYPANIVSYDTDEFWASAKRSLFIAGNAELYTHH